MKAQAFAHYSDALLTTIGLTLFVAVFVGSVIWVNIKKNRQRYAKMKSELLDDGVEV